MKHVLYTVVAVGLFLGATVVPGFAAAEHEVHHPDEAPATATAPAGGMVMPQGTQMGPMPCMAGSAPGAESQMTGMMGDGMHSMMGERMPGMMGMMNGGMMGMMQPSKASAFFLDRAGELGLSGEQIDKLRTLQTECRNDNIRNAAELKIARLELADLLAGVDWKLKDAEALVRKIQKLDGDIQVRHLQALSAARSVLTVEQLQQALAGDDAGDAKGLFQ